MNAQEIREMLLHPGRNKTDEAEQARKADRYAISTIRETSEIEKKLRYE